jgi:agmatine deiminase
MIADHESNVVFVADTLEREFPAVYSGLKDILGGHDIPLLTIAGTRSIWCRDYLPIQVSEDRFVQFRYAPDYLTGKYRHLRADGQIGPTLPWLKGVRRSEIVLDGGNVVGWGGRAIVTDKVFRENPGRSREVVAEGLKNDLGLAKLIVVPTEPDDPIGHSDGMVSWLGERSVLINDYSTVSESFRYRIHRRLGRQQIDLFELPYEPQPGGNDGIPTAAGNWMNFLRVRDVLIVPVFGMKGDERALGILREVHPGYAVEAVECCKLAREGGLLHCVTWQASWNEVSR